MQQVLLWEALDGILDAVVAKLKAQNLPGEVLDGVEEIVRGDRARPKPPIPAIFVYTETATNDHSRRAMHETWVLPVILVAVVKDDDVENGYREATKLAAKARSVVLKGRRLDLEFVQDITSGKFDASAPWLREGQVFYSMAVVNVSFAVLEI